MRKANLKTSCGSAMPGRATFVLGLYGYGNFCQGAEDIRTGKEGSETGCTLLSRGVKLSY